MATFWEMMNHIESPKDADGLRKAEERTLKVLTESARELEATIAKEQKQFVVDGIGWYDEQRASHEFKEADALTGEAAELVSRAAAGDAEALLALGKLYEASDGTDGQEIAKDLDEALWCYRASVWAALKKGRPFQEAAVRAATLLDRGTPTQKDSGLAYHYMRLAADRGNVGALYWLGAYHLDSKMVPEGGAYARNPVIGVGYLEKAAKAGDLQAMLDLSMCYTHGRGVATDEGKACEWSVRAAKKGSVVAMYNAGHWLERRGDYDQAGYWFNEAARRGNKDAEQRLSKYHYSSVQGTWEYLW